MVLEDMKRWFDESGYKAHSPIEVRFTKADDVFLSPCYGQDSCYINILCFRSVIRFIYYAPCLRVIKPAQRRFKPGTHHAIFVFCWMQRRRKDDRRMVCAHQRRSSSVDFTNATVVGPIRKTNRSNNCCMVCAGQRHPSHQPTDHRPITVKHLRDASTSDLRFGHNIIYI